MQASAAREPPRPARRPSPRGGGRARRDPPAPPGELLPDRRAAGAPSRKHRSLRGSERRVPRAATRPPRQAGWTGRARLRPRGACVRPGGRSGGFQAGSRARRGARSTCCRRRLGPGPGLRLPRARPPRPPNCGGGAGAVRARLSQDTCGGRRGRGLGTRASEEVGAAGGDGAYSRPAAAAARGCSQRCPSGPALRGCGRWTSPWAPALQRPSRGAAFAKARSGGFPSERPPSPAI